MIFIFIIQHYTILKLRAAFITLVNKNKFFKHCFRFFRHSWREICYKINKKVFKQVSKLYFDED
jgi:hypothetical protein